MRWVFLLTPVGKLNYKNSIVFFYSVNKQRIRKRLWRRNRIDEEWLGFKALDGSSLMAEIARLVELEVKWNSNKILFVNHHQQSKATQIAFHSDVSFLIEVMKAIKNQFLEDSRDSKDILNDNVVETVRKIKKTGSILQRKTFLDHEILI